jgi:thioredoxin-dependent peroxiredoxin
MPGSGGSWREDFSLRAVQKGSGKGDRARRFPNGPSGLQTIPSGHRVADPMKLTLLGLLVLFAALAFPATSRAAELKVGDSAPAVTGITETGQKLNFADVYAKQPYTLVYFYPKADTSGCTAQGCSLRDAYEVLTQKGVAVIGVSMDQVEAQKAFKDKNHFPFPLIADPDKTIVNAFGVPTKVIPALGEIAMRQAFLIKDGKIVWADYKAKTTKQADDVLAVVAAQKA